MICEECWDKAYSLGQGTGKTQTEAYFELVKANPGCPHNPDPVRATSEASRVELMQNELDTLREQFAQAHANFQEMAERNHQKILRIAELEAALKPFAAQAKMYLPERSDNTQVYAELGDCRNAARALAGEGEED